MGGARRLFDRGLCREAKSIYHVCNFYFRTKTHKPKVRGLGVSPQPCRACFTYVVGVHVDYVSYVDAWAVLSLTALANKQNLKLPVKKEILPENSEIFVAR